MFGQIHSQFVLLSKILFPPSRLGRNILPVSLHHPFCECIYSQRDSILCAHGLTHPFLCPCHLCPKAVPPGTLVRVLDCHKSYGGQDDTDWGEKYAHTIIVCQCRKGSAGLLRLLHIHAFFLPFCLRFLVALKVFPENLHSVSFHFSHALNLHLSDVRASKLRH